MLITSLHPTTHLARQATILVQSPTDSTATNLTVLSLPEKKLKLKYFEDLSSLHTTKVLKIKRFIMTEFLFSNRLVLMKNDERNDRAMLMLNSKAIL